MPPRFAYWTILVGGLPTAFRSAEREELMPTFKRLQEKHADAEMRWFARGKLWSSPEEATAETARLKAQGSRPKWDSDRGAPRDRNWRPGGTHQDPRQPYKDAKKRGNQERRQQRFDRKSDQGPRPEWKRDQGTRPNDQRPLPTGDRGPRRAVGTKPEWKTDRPEGARPKWSGEKPAWKRDQGPRPPGPRGPKR